MLNATFPTFKTTRAVNPAACRPNKYSNSCYLKRSIANAKGILYGLVPVRVLVLQGGVDLVEMVVVCVADEST